MADAVGIVVSMAFCLASEMYRKNFKMQKWQHQ